MVMGVIRTVPGVIRTVPGEHKTAANRAAELEVFLLASASLVNGWAPFMGKTKACLLDAQNRTHLDKEIQRCWTCIFNLAR